MSLTFAELNRANSLRCQQSYHPIYRWSPTDWACALAGEVGEACNLIKKLRRLDDAGPWLDTSEARSALELEIADELADAQMYLDLLAERLGISLEIAVRQKFNRTSDQIGSTVRL